MNLNERTARLSLSTDDDTPSPSPTSSQRATNLLTRTTIREANNHLQMLYTRNQELEQMIDKQKEDMERKNHEFEHLSRASQLLERHCQQLQALLDDRTRRLLVYERKEALFRETLELKPAIESLLDVLTSFEQVDQNSAGPTATNPKPLQFVQSLPKKKTTNEVFHRTDAV